jgi:HK97 family phage portal protein
MPVNDERAWQGLGHGAPNAAREIVNAQTALKISTYWACVSLIADSVAMLPKFVYRRRADGGRERADNHPLFDILHTQPNTDQTSFEFFEMLTGHALRRGNAYARIVPGPRGPADQLLPLHPDKVRIEILPNGKSRYMIRQRTGQEDPFNDEDILHLKGLSDDGVRGLDNVALESESLGLSLASQKYSSRFYGNDSSPGGVLKSKGKLSPEAQTRLKASWQEAHTGSNQHRVAVLEEGLEWQGVSFNARESQFIEREEFQAEDICRWKRVPPHMVGLTSKATTWGSGIEQMSIGFVTYTLMPWLVRWQQAISRDLIIAPQVYFVEFVVDGLLRGDALSRYNVYNIGRNMGVLSANDIRRLENMNPREDGGGDAYLTPLNMQPSAGKIGGHYTALMHETAARIARKEQAALTRAAKKAGQNGDWAEAVEKFLDDHAAFVAESLCVPLAYAQRYVLEQHRRLMAGGPGILDDWEAQSTQVLIELTAPGEPL